MKKDKKPDPAAGRLSSIPGQKAGSRSASGKNRTNYDLGRLGIAPSTATDSAQLPKQPTRPDPVVSRPKPTPTKHSELRRLSVEMSPTATGRASPSAERTDHKSWLGPFERLRSFDRRTLAVAGALVCLVIVVSVWALCSGVDTNPIGPRAASAEDGLAAGNADGAPDSGADAPPRTDAGVASSQTIVSPRTAAVPAPSRRAASARQSPPPPDMPASKSRDIVKSCG